MPLANPPYQPSWVDRFIDWIDRLPMPNWLFYIILYLFGLLIIHTALWIDGVTPLGELNPLWAFNAIYIFLSLGFLHLLERTAHRAVDKFSPLVPDKQRELEIQRFKMTTMPAKPVFWMTTVFGAFMIVVALTQPGFVYEGWSSPISYILMLSGLVFAFSFVPILLYQATRLLKSVTDVYKLVEQVNVFHQQPLYAFSGLTLQASAFWILFGNLSFVGMSLQEEVPTAQFALEMTTSVLIIGLAFLTFLVPYWGIHRRLVEGKLQIQEETSVQIDDTQRQLFAAIKSKNHKEINTFDSAISSLYRVNEQLKKIPTWPWAPGMFRNFLSVVFVPMLLWILQELASRYL